MSLMTYKTWTALGVGALAFGLAFVGCSSDDTSTPTPDADNGGAKDSGTGPAKDSGPGMVTHEGTITVFPPGTATGVAEATIDVGGGRTTTTDAKGVYSLQVPKDTPYFMRISKPGYTTLIEQEWQLSGDTKRGKSVFPDREATNTLVQVIEANASLPKVDPAKGVLAIGLIKGTCATEAGAVISLEPTTANFATRADDAGDAGNDGGADAGLDAGTDAGSDPNSNRVIYISSTGFPNTSAQKSLAGATTPTALIYNVTPGNRFRVKVVHPDCNTEPFPFDDPAVPTIRYTGNIVVEPLGNPHKDAGANVTNVSTFARILLSRK